MALAYSVIRQGVEDRNRWVEADVTFDSSYPTGGETVTLPGDLGLNEVRRIHRVFDVYPDGNTSAATDDDGYDVVPSLTSPTAPKLLLYYNGAQVSNATDVSAVIKRLRFIGS